jgi:hypothetical protein
MSISGCSAIMPSVTSTVTSTVTITSTVTPVLEDKPYLTEQEAIALVKKHAINSPDSNIEKLLGIIFQRGVTATPQAAVWNAVYMGLGKWNVSYSDYHWTVFEDGIKVIFVGQE